MQRKISFSFRLTNNERQLIRQLALALQRSQSDAVRFVVIEAAKQLAQAATVSDLSMPTQEIEQEEKHVTG